MQIEYKKDFLKTIDKIKDRALKIRVIKQVEKIIAVPSIGKPMRFSRKGTREVHVSPYRLAYSYSQSEDRLIFLEIYHKDEQ